MNSKNNELELFTNCETWAKNGECDKNPNYMGKYCQHKNLIFVKCHIVCGVLWAGP